MSTTLDSLRDAIRSRFLTELTATAPELVPAGRALLARISAGNWSLEWGLPLWLGEALGASDSVIADTVLFNAFGLGFVRLADDLSDGESPLGTEPTPEGGLPSPARADWVLLSVTLQHLASLQCERLSRGATGPLLWSRFDEAMNQWLRASTERTQPTRAAFSRLTDEDFLRLAHRGAPLKVCGAAMALASGRPDLLEPVERVIDELLVACVLLDHVYDWASDLESGRYNAFVSYCAELGSPGASRSKRDLVLRELYLGEAGKGYFRLFARWADSARARAQTLGCPGLASFIDTFSLEAAAYQRWLATSTRERLHDVLEAASGDEALPDATR